MSVNVVNSLINHRHRFRFQVSVVGLCIETFLGTACKTHADRQTPLL